MKSRYFFLVTGVVAAMTLAASATYAVKEVELEDTDVNRVARELQGEKPGLTAEEAHRLAEQALREGSAESHPELAGALREGTGVAGYVNAQAIGIGGVVPQGMTPEKQTLAEHIGVRADELAKQDFSHDQIDKILREEFGLEKRFEEYQPSSGGPER